MNPVYLALVRRAFARRVGRRYRLLIRIGYREDWDHEIELAALEADAVQLSEQRTLRYANSRAHAALKAAGFHQKETHDETTGKRRMQYVFDSQLSPIAAELLPA